VAYDEDLADRIREILSGRKYVEKKMFGGLAFLIGGNMSVAASGQGGLLVRVDPAENDTLLTEPGAAPMEMGGRGPMTGWIRVEAGVLDAATLKRWVSRGVGYAEKLPAK
jgi:TfoX/Sxy family transcriptional regulator of competence genes